MSKLKSAADYFLDKYPRIFRDLKTETPTIRAVLEEVLTYDYGDDEVAAYFSGYNDSIKKSALEYEKNIQSAITQVYQSAYSIGFTQGAQMKGIITDYKAPSLNKLNQIS